jgi:hypothetical protein
VEKRKLRELRMSCGCAAPLAVRSRGNERCTDAILLLPSSCGGPLEHRLDQIENGDNTDRPKGSFDDNGMRRLALVHPFQGVGEGVTATNECGWSRDLFRTGRFEHACVQDSCDLDVGDDTRLTGWGHDDDRMDSVRGHHSRSSSRRKARLADHDTSVHDVADVLPVGFHSAFSLSCGFTTWLPGLGRDAIGADTEVLCGELPKRR